MAVPVNLKDRDAFHLTIEEYLLALVSLIDELVRSPSPLQSTPKFPSHHLTNTTHRPASPATP